MTTSALRAKAAEIVAAFDRATAIRTAVLTFDKDTAAQLAALDRELAEFSIAAGEDVSSLQILLARREARARVAERLAGEREQLVVRVRKDELAAVADVDLPAFFRAAIALEMEKVLPAFQPFYENEPRARAAAGNCDSITMLSRWCGFLVAQIPAEAIARRLKAFVSGEKPVWQI